MKALAFAVMLASCGGDDQPVTVDARLVDALPPDAPPREVIMSTQGLPAGELVEGIMTASEADLAVIRLSAPVAQIGWNIHGHANGMTQIVHEEHDTGAVEFVFVPPAQADWYLLVRNESQINMDVQIRVEMYGAMTWRWQ